MLLSEKITTEKNELVIVLFGGNLFRRDEVIKLLATIENFTIYGVLSEEEGMEKIATLPKIDLVVIGGAYNNFQRIRIRKFISENLTHTKISEPGWSYDYNNEAIKNDIKSKLNIH